MYKLIRNRTTNEINCVNHEVNEILYSIPFDPANTDYQAYLKWLSEGNEPLPADEPQQSTVEPTPAVEVPVVTDPSVDEALPVEEPNEG